MTAGKARRPLKLDSVQRILVCQLRQIGDVLLATPSLELLHRRFPGAEIHVLTELKCAPMLENNPHVHDIFRLDKASFPTFLHELAWYWNISRQRYDMVIDFQQLPRCRWVAAFSGAAIRLTYLPSWWKRHIYTHYAPLLPGYAAQTKASILRLLGIEWNDETPKLWLRPEEVSDVRHGLLQAGIDHERRLVTMDVTHKDPERRWPALHYAELIEALSCREDDLRFLLLYGPGEKNQADAVRNLCRRHDAVISVPPTGSPRTAAAYISLASMHVGNCSAPRHMAVAVGTPSFTLPMNSGPQWRCPMPQHVDMEGLPGKTANGTEADRHAMVMAVCNAVLEHLRRYGKRGTTGETWPA